MFEIDKYFWGEIGKRYAKFNTIKTDWVRAPKRECEMSFNQSAKIMVSDPERTEVTWE